MCVCCFVLLTRYWVCVCVCVLLCFVDPILGNRYGPGVSAFRHWPWVARSSLSTVSTSLTIPSTNNHHTSNGWQTDSKRRPEKLEPLAGPLGQLALTLVGQNHLIQATVSGGCSREIIALKRSALRSPLFPLALPFSPKERKCERKTKNLDLAGSSIGHATRSSIWAHLCLTCTRSYAYIANI